MVDGMLYVKVNEDTFELDSDSELKKSKEAALSALGTGAVAAAVAEEE